MSSVTDETSATDPSAAKRELRAAIRASRQARSADQRAADDLARTRQLARVVAAARPRCVAGYLSAGTEPDTTAIVDDLVARGIQVLLPVATAGAWREPVWAVSLSAL